ncbi:MAG: hypothetical protein K2M43_03175 [Mycoplasmoidaceae bacterium]|nr:hypothetical protein [Mycoplasmoidaceae bacterium]
MKDKSIVFFGTPKIAAKCLNALIEINANVVAVVTRADKPSGRNHKVIANEVKQLAIKNNIQVYQPENLNDFVDQIKQINPDLIFTCAYGKIIPDSILNIPKYK